MNTGKLKIIIWITTFLLACSEENIKPSDGIPEGDYFPLTDRVTRTYTVETGCNCNCPCKDYPEAKGPSYSFSHLIEGDTILDGKAYKKMHRTDGDVYRYVVSFVRREGSKYYIRSIYETTESLFLDTSFPVDSTWIEASNPANQFKIENTIVMFSPTMTIKGKLFDNVIVVKKATSYSDSDTGYCDQSDVVYHYYAEGVGEILSHRPYSPCTYYSGDTNICLTDLQ